LPASPQSIAGGMKLMSAALSGVYSFGWARAGNRADRTVDRGFKFERTGKPSHLAAVLLHLQDENIRC
jgi:hypothetical protein